MQLEALNSSIKVSVIVPVWNPGPGIIRCIDSLVNQTLKDIEIIFIDDCGTDGSMHQVQTAAASDSRIRIITNNCNLGPGPSRNRGIQYARGEYLSFVDADDFVAKDFLELLYCAARDNSSDIAKGRHELFFDNGACYTLQPYNINTAIEARHAGHTPLMAVFFCEHWTAIYRRAVFTQFHITYGNTLFNEDSVFLLRLCAQTESIVIEADAVYYYVCRPDSLTNKIREQTLTEYIAGFHAICRTLLENYDSSQHSRRYAVGRIYLFIDRFFQAGLLPGFSTVVSRYCKDLCHEICNLPFCEEIIRRHPAIRVLVECKLALPVRYRISTSLRDELSYGTSVIAGWVDFFIQHPEYRGLCEGILFNLLCSKPILYTDTFKRKEGMRFVFYRVVQRELRRLPAGYYLHLSAKIVRRLISDYLSSN